MKNPSISDFILNLDIDMIDIWLKFLEGIF